MRVARRLLIAWSVMALVALGCLGVFDWARSGKIYSFETGHYVYRKDNLGHVLKRNDYGKWEKSSNEALKGRAMRNEAESPDAGADHVERFGPGGQHKKAYLVLGGLAAFLGGTAMAMPKKERVHGSEL